MNDVRYDICLASGSVPLLAIENDFHHSDNILQQCIEDFVMN